MGRPKEFDRNEVLDKAIQVFWSKGFAETSLQDLEKATGVNKSGLYSEFKDKNDLFLQSLKRYAETTTVLEVLRSEPPGRGNLENFLLAGHVCKGRRGCFLANSVREADILSVAAKKQMKTHMDEVKEAVVKNVKACAKNEDSESLADLILTFGSGLSLSANMGEVKEVEKRVKTFLDKILD